MALATFVLFILFLRIRVTWGRFSPAISSSRRGRDLVSQLLRRVPLGNLQEMYYYSRHTYCSTDTCNTELTRAIQCLNIYYSADTSAVLTRLHYWHIYSTETSAVLTHLLQYWHIYYSADTSTVLKHLQYWHIYYSTDTSTTVLKHLLQYWHIYSTETSTTVLTYLLQDWLICYRTDSSATVLRKTLQY